jgi:hypothetical protein
MTVPDPFTLKLSPMTGSLTITAIHFAMHHKPAHLRSTAKGIRSALIFRSVGSSHAPNFDGFPADNLYAEENQLVTWLGKCKIFYSIVVTS